MAITMADKLQEENEKDIIEQVGGMGDLRLVCDVRMSGVGHFESYLCQKFLAN